MSVSPWPSIFEINDSRSRAVGGSIFCYVWGPRGAARVVRCKAELVPRSDGSQEARALHLPCAACGEVYFLDLDLAPFRLDETPRPFETHEGVKRLPTVTLMRLFECTSPSCDLVAVIRGGVAYELAAVQAIFRNLLKASADALGAAARLAKSRGSAQAQAEIQKMDAAHRVAAQRIATSEYAENGAGTIVGCWDVLEGIYLASSAAIKQMGGQ